MTSEGAAPAAWYPDGVGSRLRYWDGSAWTDYYAEPAGAQPLAASPVTPPKPMHPAAVAALAIAGLTVLTILIVVIVYFVGVPTAAVPNVAHSPNGVSSQS
jgi:hypothetical protein